MTYDIYFSHGKESGPNSHKIKYLKKIALEPGFHSNIIDYRSTKDPEARVKILLNNCKNSQSK